MTRVGYEGMEECVWLNRGQETEPVSASVRWHEKVPQGILELTTYWGTLPLPYFHREFLS